MVVSGTSFLTTILIGRGLGKHQLGLYVLAYSIVVVLLEVQNSFIASPYTMKSPQLDLPAQARYTGSALVLTIGLSAIAAVVLFAVGIIFPAKSGLGEVKPLFLIVSLIAAPLLLREFGRRVCFAHFHVREVLFLDSLGSVIQIGGLLLLIYFGSRSLRSVYWLIASASGITAIVWWSSWRHKTVITFDGALLALRNTWSFGMWVLTGNLAIVLSQQVYPWYLGSLKGPDATATFATCTYLLALVNPFLTGVGNYLGPVTANASIRGDSELSRVVMRASLLLFLVVGMFSLAIVMFGNHLLQLLYGAGYRIDIHVLAVLGASVVVLNSTLAVGFGFWAIGRPDVNLKINSLAIVLAVTAGPLLVWLYGLVGAAFGLLLAALSVSVLRVWLLRRVLHRI
jgi:O-antigen/teichoic acid export membrane protein